MRQQGPAKLGSGITAAWTRDEAAGPGRGGLGDADNSVGADKVGVQKLTSPQELPQLTQG